MRTVLFVLTVLALAISPLQFAAADENELPVLIEDVRTGTVIEEEMLTWQPHQATKLQRQVFTSLEGLVGMEAKRPIRAGEPIRTLDVHPPIWVRKGDLVVLRAQNTHMQLTAQGRALAHGRELEIVRVLNTQSKQVVEGIVTAPGLVQVPLPGQVR